MREMAGLGVLSDGPALNLALMVATVFLTLAQPSDIKLCLELSKVIWLNRVMGSQLA